MTHTFSPGETAWCPAHGFMKVQSNPVVDSSYSLVAVAGEITMSVTSQGKWHSGGLEPMLDLQTLPQAKAYLEEQLAIVREAIAAQPKALTPLKVAREIGARKFPHSAEAYRNGDCDLFIEMNLLIGFITKHHNTPEQLAALMADGAAAGDAAI